MSITIDMSAQEIAALRQLTRLENDAAAVVQAAREFLRQSRLRELNAVSGKIEIDNHGEELERRELKELDFPE